MTVAEAKERIKDYLMHHLNMNEEDEFILNELCRFVYEETGDTTYLLEGAGTYIADPKKQEKVYLLSIESGVEHAAYTLGELYESGKLGKPNYAKAYEYYLRASKTEPIGDGSSIDNSFWQVHNDAKIRLAKMYKHGIYVKKDLDKYKDLINEAYEDVKDKDWAYIRYNSLFAKAKLELEEGNIEKGLEILYLAREEFWKLLVDLQEERDYELLNEMNELLYRYQELDYTDISAEDITELLKKPITLGFMYDDVCHEITSRKDGEETVVEFKGNLYRNPIDFIMKARIGDIWFREVLFVSYLWEVKR